VPDAEAHSRWVIRHSQFTIAKGARTAGGASRGAKADLPVRHNALKPEFIGATAPGIRQIERVVGDD